jgi:hypothetical protein
MLRINIHQALSFLIVVQRTLTAAHKKKRATDLPLGTGVTFFSNLNQKENAALGYATSPGVIVLFSHHRVLSSWLP